MEQEMAEESSNKYSIADGVPNYCEPIGSTHFERNNLKLQLSSLIKKKQTARKIWNKALITEGTTLKIENSKCVNLMLFSMAKSCLKM